MSSQRTLPDILKSTCSPGSADGPTPSGLPDGPQTGPSGPARARASRSRSPDAAQAPVTNGTYGPTCFASSVPVGPLSSWESRLRERLAMAGSMEFPLIWKQKTTPAGRLISRLAPSMRRTSGAGCTGALWGTPCANPAGSSAEAFLERKRRSVARGSKMGVALTDLGLQMAAWPTPRVSAGKGAGNATRGLDGGNCRLEDTVAMAAPVGRLHPHCLPRRQSAACPTRNFPAG